MFRKMLNVLASLCGFCGGCLLLVSIAQAGGGCNNQPVQQPAPAPQQALAAPLAQAAPVSRDIARSECTQCQKAQVALQPAAQPALVAENVCLHSKGGFLAKLRAPKNEVDTTVVTRTRTRTRSTLAVQ